MNVGAIVDFGVIVSIFGLGGAIGVDGAKSFVTILGGSDDFGL